MAERFPEEVLIGILCRLPINDLMRFRCVSKSWLQLLSINLHFIESNVNRPIIINPNPSIIGITLSYSRNLIPKTRFYFAEEYRSCNEAIEIDLPFNKLSPKLHTVVSTPCNGLVCLTDSDESNVYVWNPLTNDHITIACSPIPSDFRSSTIVFGFGFCQDSNEYKVIRIVSDEYVYPMTELKSIVSVYTLGEDSWRTKDIEFHFNNSSLATLVNGTLHWLVGSLKSISWSGAGPQLYYPNFEKKVIVSFDVKDECLKKILLPDRFEYAYDYLYEMELGDLSGSLCVFCNLPKEEVHIWSMKEYGVVDSWSKEYVIGRVQIPGPFSVLKPLCVANNGEIIIKKNDFELVACDPNTASARDLRRFQHAVHMAFTYVGTLVSPTFIHAARHDNDMVESRRKRKR